MEAQTCGYNQREASFNKSFTKSVNQTSTYPLGYILKEDPSSKDVQIKLQITFYMWKSI
jgi:hypothetical protein